MAKEQIKQKSIIWVEDEQMLIDIYIKTLQGEGNLKIEFMKLGQLAINRIKEIEQGKAKIPDLIIIDLLLPDINGDRILEEIRKSPATKDIPVFILTNYSGEQMEKKLTQELDAEKYLVKTEWGPIKLIPLIKEAVK
jgi:CheY-like chemotaxis protein